MAQSFKLPVLLPPTRLTTDFNVPAIPIRTGSGWNPTIALSSGVPLHKAHDLIHMILTHSYRADSSESVSPSAAQRIQREACFCRPTTGRAESKALMLCFLCSQSAAD
jgi:hypothetical protein